MLREYRVVLSWALAVATVFVLPCCLVCQLDLNQARPTSITCPEQFPCSPAGSSCSLRLQRQ